MIYVERASPATLTDFKDALADRLLGILEPWSIDFRTYRCLIKNLPSDASKLMCSITFSHYERRTVLIKNKLALVTTSAPNDVSKGLMANGCCTGTPESIDAILSGRLSNIWTQRQSIKGEAGETFETTDLLVRAVNLFSYTGFKGLVIELHSTEDATEESFKRDVEKIRSILKEMGMGDVKVSGEQLDPSQTNFISDLAYQYVRVLEF